MVLEILVTLMSEGGCASCRLALGICGTRVPAEVARELSVPSRGFSGLVAGVVTLICLLGVATTLPLGNAARLIGC